jgi:hypothetical protein
VTSTLRLARDSAVLREQPVEVRFSPDTDQYQLALIDSRGERIELRERRRRTRGQDERIRFPGREALAVRRLPGGGAVFFPVVYTAAPLTEDSELPRVIFYPDGSATPATIALQDERNHTLSVEIYRASGVARVQEGLPPVKEKVKTLYYGPRKD